MRCAALDIGTVTCRLLVADVDETGIHDLCRRSEITNLGEGVDATGCLLPQAIDRVCERLEEYLELVASYAQGEQPIPIRAMATSASRDASNADEFIARSHELGVDLSIIPGEQEAELSFLGASADFAGEKLLVSDVGGGSSELIAGIAGQGVVYAHSFNIGCRRALERTLHSDPPTAAEIAELANWTREEFASFFSELDKRGFVPERYVAVAGTATSVVAMDRKIDPYDPEKVHAQSVSAEALAAITDSLSRMTLEQRYHVVGLQQRRAQIIVAGLVIMQQILALSGLPSFTASESDILEGIILDMYRRA